MATDAAPRGTDRDGFTLVEVLFAMVILAVGLLALEAMAIGASRSITAANLTTEYTLIASQRLETVLEQARDVNQNPVSTDQVLANGTLVSTNVATNGAGGATGTLYTVRVTVTPPAARVGTLNLSPVTLTGRVHR